MKFDIVRAWKDAAYRESLSAQEQAMLPASPAGEFELSEADLEAVNGGNGSGGGQTILNSVATAASCLQSDLAPCLTLNGNCFNSGSN
jgi:mersacidin/lichenicidin family type 2 lantibiotic